MRYLRVAAAVLAGLLACGLAPPAGAQAAGRPGRAATALGASTSDDGALLDRLRNLADPAADAVVADLFAGGWMDTANRALNEWSGNSQALPQDMPAPLSAFLEKARVLPGWADPAMLDRASAYLGAHSLPVGFVWGLQVASNRPSHPGELAALLGATGPSDNKLALAKTSWVLQAVTQPGGFAPEGSAIAALLKLRLIHASVRYLLLHQSGQSWDAAAYGAPINQADMLAEWSMFAPATVDTLARLGVAMNAAQTSDYLRVWQVIAAVLGMDAPNVPTDPEHARALAAVIDQRTPADLDPRAAAYIQATVTALAKAMAPIPTTLSYPIMMAMLRETDGQALADRLQLPRSPLWDPAASIAVPVLFRADWQSAALFNPLVYQMHDTAIVLGRKMLTSGTDTPLQMITKLRPYGT